MPLVAGKETADWTGHARLSHRGLLTLRTSAAPQVQSLEEAQALVTSAWQPRSSLQPSLGNDGDSLHGASMAARDWRAVHLPSPGQAPEKGWRGVGGFTVSLTADPSKAKRAPMWGTATLGSIQPAQLGTTTLLSLSETCFGYICQQSGKCIEHFAGMAL